MLPPWGEVEGIVAPWGEVEGIVAPLGEVEGIGAPLVGGIGYCCPPGVSRGSCPFWGIHHQLYAFRQGRESLTGQRTKHKNYSRELP